MYNEMTQVKMKNFHGTWSRKEPGGSVGSYRDYELCYSWFKERREKNLVLLPRYLTAAALLRIGFTYPTRVLFFVYATSSLS